MIQPSVKLIKYTYDVPAVFVGFQNALFSQTPRYLWNTTFTPSTEDFMNLPPYEQCDESAFEIKDPPPLQGWDTRCRKWY